MGLRPARAASRRRADAGSSRLARSRPGRRHFRSDGAIDCRLRGLCRGDVVYLEVRRGTRGQGAVHDARAGGYDLFRGKAQCNACHRDGGPGEDPLFTDFTASNIGTPANPRLPYYAEDRPDALGYVANPAGSSFIDSGVGNFLTQGQLLSQPSAVDQRWVKLAPGNQARIQVPTLRNVDKRPYPAFVKAYMHNGYFTSLKAIVHFYNTRDVLPRCQSMRSVKVRHAGRRRSRPTT